MAISLPPSAALSRDGSHNRSPRVLPLTRLTSAGPTILAHAASRAHCIWTAATQKLSFRHSSNRFNRRIWWIPDAPSALPLAGHYAAFFLCFISHNRNPKVFVAAIVPRLGSCSPISPFTYIIPLGQKNETLFSAFPKFFYGDADSMRLCDDVKIALCFACKWKLISN